MKRHSLPITALVLLFVLGGIWYFLPIVAEKIIGREFTSPIGEGDEHFQMCAKFARTSPAINEDIGTVNAAVLDTPSRVTASPGELVVSCALLVTGERGSGSLAVKFMVSGQETRFMKASWTAGGKKPQPLNAAGVMRGENDI